MKSAAEVFFNLLFCETNFFIPYFLTVISFEIVDKHIVGALSESAESLKKLLLEDTVDSGVFVLLFFITFYYAIAELKSFSSFSTLVNKWLRMRSARSKKRPSISQKSLPLTRVSSRFISGSL